METVSALADGTNLSIANTAVSVTAARRKNIGTPVQALECNSLRARERHWSGWRAPGRRGNWPKSWWGVLRSAAPTGAKSPKFFYVLSQSSLLPLLKRTKDMQKTCRLLIGKQE